MLREQSVWHVTLVWGELQILVRRNPDLRNEPFTRQQARILWLTCPISYSLPINSLLSPNTLSLHARETFSFLSFFFFELKVGLFRFFRKIRLKHMFGNSDIQYKGLIHLCLSLKAHSYLTPQIPLSKHFAEWLSKKLLKDNPSHSLCLKTNPTFDFQKKVSEATGAALCSV